MVMDYKKKLERAKELYKTANADQRYVLESLFPELKESEDEKNIKDLIDELKCSLRAANCQNDACGGGHEKRIALLEWGIAWLEKQGKQKHVDKVEPKFNEGDIIKPKDGSHEPWKIMQVDMSDKKYRFKDGYVIHFSQENDYELVEQTAANKAEPTPDFELSLKHIMEEAIECGDTHNLKADAELLYNIAQKSAKWSEEDEKIYSRIYDLINAAAYANYEVDEDGKELGEYGKIARWFKSIKDRVGCEVNCTTTKSGSRAMNNLENLKMYLDQIRIHGMKIYFVNYMNN